MLLYGTKEQRAKVEKELERLGRKDAIEISGRNKKLKQMQEQMRVLERYENKQYFMQLNPNFVPGST